MTDRMTLRRAYWILWFALTMLTGILAGFLLSHSIMLGRYFTWLIESGNSRVCSLQPCALDISCPGRCLGDSLLH